MYKFAISYYTMSGVNRVPLTGLTVKLVVPGADWASGLALTETVANSGHYEVDIATEAECGFFEIWDNQNNPSGAFSGKTCLVGKIDARGIQNNAIYGNHILNGVVTGPKIANNSIQASHLNTAFLVPFAMVTHETQTQDDGIGTTTTSTPPEATDLSADHVFANEYDSMPVVIVSANSKIAVYVENLDLTDKVLSVRVGFINADAAVPEYTILVL